MFRIVSKDNCQPRLTRRARDIQVLLNGGNRQNALMRILQLQSRFLRLYGPRLDQKDAGDDLQTVGNSSKASSVVVCVPSA
jgi:hypothetical protein